MQFRVNNNITKLVLLLSIPFASLLVKAQEKSLKNNHTLAFEIKEKDDWFYKDSLNLKTLFFNKENAIQYIQKLPILLASKGYPVASVDSVFQSDTLTRVMLFLGKKYQSVNITFPDIEPAALEKLRQKYENKKSISWFSKIDLMQESLLNYYENNGYPFATVYLDSIYLENGTLSAQMNVNKGLYYNIDSIRIFGDAMISGVFLQRYLNIFNNSFYSKEKLRRVDSKILELPFVKSIQPSDITMLGSGGILNLYLQTKKCSQFNFLVGLQPSSNNNSNLQFTGDINLDLKNIFAKGENLIMKWQQLQKNSPRLLAGFSFPYVFRSALGVDMLFELFKKDSAFLQVNTKFGINFSSSEFSTGRIFVQYQNFSLLDGAIDSNLIKATKSLPSNIDMSTANTGINFEINKTNYRLNPRKGYQLNFTSLVGTKKIKVNNDISNIREAGFNYSSLYDSIRLKNYQLKFVLNAAHYFPVKKNNAVKLALNFGYYNSPVIFKNDLFQIGGFKTLRGFDEESIYASSYAVISMEYRILLSLNSYIASFIDWARVNKSYQSISSSDNFIGAGISMIYETKGGLLNISYALGKKENLPINLRDASKIHFGYINYF